MGGRGVEWEAGEEEAEVGGVGLSGRQGGPAAKGNEQDAGGVTERRRY